MGGSSEGTLGRSGGADFVLRGSPCSCPCPCPCATSGGVFAPPSPGEVRRGAACPARGGRLPIGEEIGDEPPPRASATSSATAAATSATLAGRRTEWSPVSPAPSRWRVCTALGELDSGCLQRTAARSPGRATRSLWRSLLSEGRPRTSWLFSSASMTRAPSATAFCSGDLPSTRKSPANDTGEGLRASPIRSTGGCEGCHRAVFYPK